MYHSTGREVLKLVGEGYSSNEIERDLCISIKTVETYRADILARLNLRNASALAASGVEMGLVTR